MAESEPYFYYRLRTQLTLDFVRMMESALPEIVELFDTNGRPSREVGFVSNTLDISGRSGIVSVGPLLGSILSKADFVRMKAEDNMLMPMLNLMCSLYFDLADFVRMKPSSTTQLELRTFCPCLLYTSPSPRDGLLSRMPSSA